MANTYKLTPRSDKNFTIRLKTLDTRFRVRSCKYPRILKFDIFNKLQQKRRTTISLKPVRYLQRFLYQPHSRKVKTLPIYQQHKLVRRPYIHFANPEPINKAKAAGFFSFNADDEFNVCYSPFLLFNIISKNSSKFLFLNNLTYNTNADLNSRFFANYSKTEIKATALSFWAKRLVYKAEYKSRDLAFLIPNIRNLGYFKFAYLVGSDKLKAFYNQKLFNYPQMVYKNNAVFESKPYIVKGSVVRKRFVQKKLRLIYKLKLNLFSLLKKQMLRNTIGLPFDITEYVNSCQSHLCESIIDPSASVDSLLSDFRVVSNPFSSFVYGLNSLKRLYFILYYSIQKQNLLKIQNVKKNFQALKSQISNKIQKHKTFSLWKKPQIRLSIRSSFKSK